MRVAAVAVFLAAALAGASAQATNCTALAMNVNSCVQAAYANYTGNNNNNNYNPVSVCCSLQAALNNACGSLQTQLGAKFFLVDTNAQQAVLNAALSCPANTTTGTSCVASTTALFQCALPAALGVTQYTFPFFNITGGSFTIYFTLIDGSTATTGPIALNASVSTISAAINAASPQAPFIITSIKQDTTNNTGTFNLTITANANPSSPMTAVIINSGGLMGAPPTGIPPIVMAVQQAVTPTSVSATSPCCTQAAALSTSCQGYQFDNATAPNYAFAFPVNFNSYAPTFIKNYVSSCPNFPPGYCAPTLTATSQCLAAQGFYANPASLTSGPCCQWSSVSNATCNGYNATVASTIASLNLNATSSQVLQQQLSTCNGQNNNNNGGNNNNNNNNGNGTNYNTCAGTLPGLFAYTYPNGTMVPVTNMCNPTNPSDPNFGFGCNVVTTINGKPYFKYAPLAAPSAAGTYWANTGCVGL